MTDTGRIVAIIVAAGSGSRAGGDAPKQFRRVGGRALVAHAYAAFASHPSVDDVLVVAAAGSETAMREAVGADVALVVGGATRRESVAHGLAAATALRATAVLIHDAARPFVPASVIAAVVEALDSAEERLLPCPSPTRWCRRARLWAT